MPAPDARDRFFTLLRASIHDGTLVKLTLGKPNSTAPSADPTLRNLFVRPVALKAGPHLSFLWRHATRDITKNHPPAEAVALLETHLGPGASFLDAHLFTPAQTAQLETRPDGTARLTIKTAAAAPAPAPVTHDRAKSHLIPADAPWLRALGVTNDRGQPREGMAHKFRQIQKFTELLSTLLAEADLLPVAQASSLPSEPHRSGERQSAPSSSQLSAPLRIADMGCGKGYLTFALAAHLGPRAEVLGIEFRPELVALCNDLARSPTHPLPNLRFVAGDIASAFNTSSASTSFLDSTSPDLARLDVLVALHACDTATDDALAKGIAAGARLLVVSPCCQKELRAQLTAPDLLVDALRHGIFQERQAEFVTDALRAMLLEWAGYRTKVFEFISTEHTAKNLMITAVRPPSAPRPPRADEPLAARIRAFASFYGVRHQTLATHLGFDLRGA